MKDFWKNRIIEKKKKNVVLYGAKSGKCKLPKREAASLRIYYMDLDNPQMTGEECISSFAQAAEKKVDAFVITRQMIACRHIFEQMLEYCKKYKADIYDERGRDIKAVCEAALQKSYVTKEALMQEIQQHENISFDIFDTLLTRKVLLPEDVFELTSRRLAEEGISVKDFKERRIKAQSILGLTNPNIHEIYDKYRKLYKITKELADACCQKELAVEQEVLIPRIEMVEVFKQCLALGKKVFLVSDMYLTKEQLIPILEKCGITGYEELYLSCEKKQLKLQGLLENYRNEHPAASYLHIGDHLIHDGICAGLAEIDYCLVANSYKLAESSVYKEAVAYAKNYEEHLMLGLAIAKALNSPFHGIGKNAKVEINSDYDYAYAFCAPLVSQFAIWLYEEIKNDDYEDILFASRDGYLMQQLYEVLLANRQDAEMPKGRYFYTSRKAAVMTGINNEAFINMIIDISPGMPPKKMMKERFGLPASKILEYDEEKYDDSIHKYVWDHVEAIFARSEEAKLNYYRYMGNVDLRIGKTYAFMDFVSSGTSQKSLKRIAPFEIKGLYAGWNGTDDKREIGVKALFENEDSYFIRHFKKMETFMTSEEPSLNYFDVQGNPVFAKQDRSERELAYVKEMQCACIDFLKEFLEFAKGNIKTISTEFTERIFAASEQAKITEKDSVLNHLRLMDDWRRKSSKVKDLLQ